jgi:type IV pilus assembly protein PilX
MHETNASSPSNRLDRLRAGRFGTILMDRVAIMNTPATGKSKCQGKQRRRIARRDRQRGISLFVVMVVVLLATLAAAWGARSALFSEMAVGADADYQRTFEAAQMMLQDAELDILGLRADGSACVPDAASPKICRSGPGIPKFPSETKEAEDLINELINAGGCKEGLCAKFSDAQDIWNPRNANLPTRLANAARYGDYTGASIGAKENDVLAAVDSGSSSDNWGTRLLQKWSGASKSGAWYWIEVLPYEESGGMTSLIEGTGSSSAVALNLKPNVVYRITVLARGIKQGQVVLQEVYARPTLDY